MRIALAQHNPGSAILAVNGLVFDCASFECPNTKQHRICFSFFDRRGIEWVHTSERGYIWQPDQDALPAAFGGGDPPSTQ